MSEMMNTSTLAPRITIQVNPELFKKVKLSNFFAFAGKDVRELIFGEVESLIQEDERFEDAVKMVRIAQTELSALDCYYLTLDLLAQVILQYQTLEGLRNALDARDSTAGSVFRRFFWNSQLALDYTIQQFYEYCWTALTLANETASIAGFESIARPSHVIGFLADEHRSLWLRLAIRRTARAGKARSLDDFIAERKKLEEARLFQ